ncbi:MAG: ATP synthase F0 subunit C [Christensenellales bacterium]|jgi:F-type H+-transporting ATPase subunit c
MKKTYYIRRVLFCFLAMVLLIAPVSMVAYAAPAQEQPSMSITSEEAIDSENTASDPISTKAIAAAITISVGAASGAIAMGIAISKSSESIARQPEAGEKIRSGLLLGLVFIETAIIYALVVAIMIVFVL